jgi:hypothetical protein
MIFDSRVRSKFAVGTYAILERNVLIVVVTVVYNEYGELVDERSLQQHPSTSDLTEIEILRVIRKGFHHQVRKLQINIRYAYLDTLVYPLIEMKFQLHFEILTFNI